MNMDEALNTLTNLQGAEYEAFRVLRDAWMREVTAASTQKRNIEKLSAKVEFLVNDRVSIGQRTGRIETIDGKWWYFLDDKPLRELTDEESAAVIWGMD